MKTSVSILSGQGGPETLSQEKKVLGRQTPKENSSKKSKHEDVQVDCFDSTKIQVTRSTEDQNELQEKNLPML